MNCDIQINKVTQTAQYYKLHQLSRHITYTDKR